MNINHSLHPTSPLAVPSKEMSYVGLGSCTQEKEAVLEMKVIRLFK